MILSVFRTILVLWFLLLMPSFGWANFVAPPSDDTPVESIVTGSTGSGGSGTGGGDVTDEGSDYIGIFNSAINIWFVLTLVILATLTIYFLLADKVNPDKTKIARDVLFYTCIAMLVLAILLAISLKWLTN